MPANQFSNPPAFPWRDGLHFRNAAQIAVQIIPSTFLSTGDSLPWSRAELVSYNDLESRPSTCLFLPVVVVHWQ